MKRYILMRTDLGMSKGKIASQAVHAAEGTAASAVVILKVSSQSDLLVYIDEAKQAGLWALAVTDAGKTKFKDTPTMTCGCIVATDDNEISKADAIVGHLSLL